MICERIDEPIHVTVMVQDEDGPVACYNGALLHTTCTADGLITMAVKGYHKGWVRERPEGLAERDLQARIEAALAVLEARGWSLDVIQAIKILKGRL